MTVCDGSYPVVFAGKMETSDEILDVPLPILQEFGSCRTASLPEFASDIETFGVLDPEDLRMAADVLAAASPDALDIVAIAKRSLAEAIEIVWSAALPAVSTPAQARALAESYKQARLYAASNPKPEWLATAKSGNFVDQLLLDIETRDIAAAPASGVAQALWESFGGAGLADRLKVSLECITSLPGSAISSAVVLAL